LARPLSRLFFGRLDARTASYGATRELMQQFFPADYRVILPGTDVLERRDHTPVEILLTADEERAALRLFLRALRGIPLELDWHATVLSRRPLAGSRAPPAWGGVGGWRARRRSAGRCEPGSSSSTPSRSARRRRWPAPMC